MNKIFTKIVAAITATSMTIFASTQSIQSITNELRTNATSISYGDVDNSGNIDSYDLVLIRKEVAFTGSTNCNLTAADVNGDGKIDSSDVREVQQYLLGIRESFSVIETNNIAIPATSIVTDNQPIETAMTQEMANKADELKDAISVYNYVYNNIRAEFYNGSRKGAIGTFEQGCGNDLDIASLLIAMLRYKGYKADYVTALVGFTEKQLLSWTHTDNIEVAEKICSSQKREHSISEYEGKSYYCCEYTYVKVEIDKKTYYLDACLKEYEKQDTVYDAIDSTYNLNDSNDIIEKKDYNLFEVSIDETFDSSALLQSQKQNITSYKIVSKNSESLPEATPHVFDNNETVYDIIPIEKHNWVTLAFNNDCKVSYHSAELYKKNIVVKYSVSYDSYELTEDGIMADTSSIFTLPSVSFGQPFSVTPIITIDGKSVLEGPNLKIGKKQNLYIVNESCGTRIEGTEVLTAGELCSIVFDTGSISSNELAEAYNKTLKNTSEINQKNNLNPDMPNDKLNENNVYSSEYLGNILRLTGLMYFSQLDISTYALAEKSDINCENTLHFGVISFKPGVYTGGTLDAKQKDGIQKDGKVLVNILSNTVSPISRTNDTAKVHAFNISRGFISSELESSVLEEIFNLESLSTASIFRYAQENSIPLVTISTDSEKKVSDLNISTEDANRIQKEVDDGKTVITVPSNITLDSWTGIGYIVSSADGATQEYYISGGYKGGSTLAPIGLYYSINVSLDVALIAESVSYIITTLAAMSSFLPIIGIAIAAICVLALTIDILEQTLLYYDYVAKDDTEAGIKIWAATATNSVTTLATLGIGKGLSIASGHVTESRLASKYGTTVIENVKKAGFSTSEINSQIKHFKKLGITQPTIDSMLKNPSCMTLSEDVLNLIGKNSGNQKELANLILNNGDDFGKLAVDIFSKEGKEGIASLVNMFGDSHLVWYRITETAEVMPGTSIPATFQIRLKVNYTNPQTGTNVLWTNANGSEHMGQYLSQFGGDNFSTNLRSQLMLESYSSALDEAMEYLISQPPARYENLIYGGWVFGIDTSTGVVFHAFPEWMVS
ncbi:dockerin type I domain-containing protein [Ruminococcus flavefaciens]|uniref:dockerin type I domain-containing protein n=1 Tax=Ruminococcus flavefaciens TaxID=1265 RepID=UPI0026EB59C2|nr:dockerin type I domain-containing protein [Ruminococcus flavefaciens]